MYRHNRRVVVLSAVVCLAPCASAVAPAAAPDAAGGLKVVRSRTTGLASFVVSSGGNALAPRPERFLDAHGHLFGVTNRVTQLRHLRTESDSLGHSHTTYAQVHASVPVFSGVLKVHQNAQGDVLAANGDFYLIPTGFNVKPKLTAVDAARAARAELERGKPEVTRAELVIVDPGWYGDPPTGVRLAYHVVLEDLAAGVSEAFFVDALKGEILDRWSTLHTAKFRSVHDGEGGSALPGTLVRQEGDGASGDFDVDAAYDYYGDTYDYYFRAFGRDGIDGAGLSMVATAHSTAPGCPNAFWSTSLQQMVFCDGTVTDDVVGHELTHGVTEHTADLIYQNQSGQLNESFSDVFGEMVDLFNGDAAFAGAPGGTPWPAHATGPGLDTPNNVRTGCSLEPDYVDGVRWLVGEDATAFGGAIRDMWSPPCEGDPDFANSALQTCPGGDSGGVHSGSGIPNHAFAMLVDGKSFNGHTVTGIGPIKAGAVWYRALSVYLTVASDFEDAYPAFNQAAADLVGNFPNDPRTGLPSLDMFTIADAAQVDEALLAVEMNTAGACGAGVDVLSSAVPPHCAGRTVIYSDDFEGGVNGWSLSNSAPPTPYDWTQVGGLPYTRAGTAWFCDDPNFGDCGANNESATHSLISPVVALPTIVGRPTLAFTHYLETEKAWDGGNISVRVNGGAWQAVGPDAFTFNGYNLTMMDTIQSGSTGPLGGLHAWSGAGGQWGTSIVNLSGFAGGGDSIEVRFDFGKDGCTGVTGWWVDDVEVYDCPCADAADCVDGRFCTGDACVNDFCVNSASVCGAAYCDETGDACVSGVVLADDFEDGESAGWNLFGPDSTAFTGRWVVGIPTGTTIDGGEAQPGAAFGGNVCVFTAQNTSAGRDDVDGGISYLVSPVIDLSAATTAELRYVRWFFNGTLGDDIEDSFAVDVSDDDGATWVNLELLDGDQSAGAWTPQIFTLENHIGLTGVVRVRFGAQDGGAGGDIIEGAIDNVRVVAELGCAVVEECCDVDGNAVRDDACSWCSCETGACGVVPLAPAFADMGGAFGACPPDGFANVHDRNHALACFSGTNGCDDLNIDAGGPFGDCAPDGFCNIHDANHALAAFAGQTPCTCPPSPMPSHGTMTAGSTSLSLRARSRTAHPGDAVDVSVFIDGALRDLRSYQLHVAVSGGRTGELELIGVTIRTRGDAAFVGDFTAVNLERGQVLSGRNVDHGVSTVAGAYLATYRYRVSRDASGVFVIDALHDRARGDQSFLVASGDREVEIAGTLPATLEVSAKAR